MTQTRFAIYWAPEPGPLADFTAAWLGWDPVSARDPNCPPDLAGLPRAREQLVAAPCRYGFHGTIKAPFRLAEGRKPEDLTEAMAALCASLSPVWLTGMELQSHDGFVALRPATQSEKLQQMALHVVRELDHFRAPLTDVEIQRRRPVDLSISQRRNLDQWGYPFVGDDFQFHLTLSGSVEQEEGDRLINVLRRPLEPLLPVPFPIDRLCLFVQQGSAPFVVVESWPLCASRKIPSKTVTAPA